MNKLISLSKKFSQTNKILFENIGSNCKITLNNEKVLNAIDIDMIKAFRNKI